MQSKVYLGLRLDSLMLRAYLSDNRVAAMRNCLALFPQGSTVQLVLCQKLRGLMATASANIQLWLLHMRTLQAWLNAFRLHPKHDRHRRLTVSHLCWEVASFAFVGSMQKRLSSLCSGCLLRRWGGTGGVTPWRVLSAALMWNVR